MRWSFPLRAVDRVEKWSRTPSREGGKPVRTPSGLRAAELAAFDGHHRLLWLLDQGLSPVSAADPDHPDSNATAIAGVDVEKYLALDRDRRLSFQSVSH